MFRGGEAIISETTVIEKSLLQFSREGTCHYTEVRGRWAHGKAAGWVRGQRSEGKCGQEPLLWFLGEGMGKAGYTGLGLTSLNNFGGIWDRGAVPV